MMDTITTFLLIIYFLYLIIAIIGICAIAATLDDHTPRETAKMFWTVVFWPFVLVYSAVMRIWLFISTLILGTKERLRW